MRGRLERDGGGVPHLGQTNERKTSLPPSSHRDRLSHSSPPPHAGENNHLAGTKMYYQNLVYFPGVPSTSRNLTTVEVNDEKPFPTKMWPREASSMSMEEMRVSGLSTESGCQKRRKSRKSQVIARDPPRRTTGTHSAETRVPRQDPLLQDNCAEIEARTGYEEKITAAQYNPLAWSEREAYPMPRIHKRNQPEREQREQ